MRTITVKANNIQQEDKRWRVEICGELKWLPGTRDPQITLRRSRRFLICDKTWVCCNLMDQSSVHGNRWGSSWHTPHYWASKPSSLRIATCPAGLMLFSHLGRPSQAIIKVMLWGHPVFLQHVAANRKRNDTHSPWDCTIRRLQSPEGLWKKL